MNCEHEEPAAKRAKTIAISTSVASLPEPSFSSLLEEYERGVRERADEKSREDYAIEFEGNRSDIGYYGVDSVRRERIRRIMKEKEWSQVQNDDWSIMYDLNIRITL